MIDLNLKNIEIALFNAHCFKNKAEKALEAISVLQLKIKDLNNEFLEIKKQSSLNASKSHESLVNEYEVIEQRKLISIDIEKTRKLKEEIKLLKILLE